MDPAQLDCAYDPEKALGTAFVARNLANFQKALDRGAQASRVDEETSMNVFELICQTPNSGKFIEACLQTGYDLQSANEDLEKYPIHFAAESFDANNIRILLESDPTLVHQTYDGQTALHIIADCIGDDFEKGSEAFLQLLEFNADINRPTNAKLETPFEILLKKLARVKDVKDDSKRDFVLAIRRKCATIDVDSYRDGAARKLLEKHFPDLVSQFPRVKAVEDFAVNDKSQNVTRLLQLMRTDEANFAQALNNLKNDPKYENAINAILEEGELLNEAVDSGKCHSVAELLRLGAAVNRCAPGSTYTPIAVACQRGNWKVLELLLARSSVAMSANNNNIINKSKAKVMDPLLTIVVKNFEGRKPSEVCNYQKCFDILVDSKHIDINDQDGSGNTALHYAVRYKNDYAIRRLLEKSAYIGATNVLDSLPIRDIAPDILESYFDSCITTNGERPGDDQFEIHFDYSCLVPATLRPAATDKSNRRHPKIAEELSPIQYIAETNELKYLIQHPLISSFLFLKWFRLSPIFYTNLVCYSVYCVSLISYIVFCFEENSAAAKILWVLSLLGALYVLIREIVQCLISPLNYVLSRENYLELGLIILTWKVLVMDETSWLYHYKHVICAFTIIFAAAELSLLVGSLPFISISTHMVMLKTVSMSFLRGLGLYSIILVAFAFSFYTLFRNTPNNKNPKNSSTDNTTDTEDSSEDELNKFVDPGRALIKTIVMMTGEFEASSIDFDQNAMSYLIFVLFLFFMSIVVLNLLNGLAVSDTQLIKSEAELNNWLERTKLLSNYENIMLGTHNNLIQNFLIQMVCMKKGSSIISMFPTFLPMWSMHIRANSNPPNQMFIAMPPNNKISQVENGEMHPLNNRPSARSKPLESSVKKLACCLCWNKCGAMDSKIVKFAKRVLNEKDVKKAEKQKQEEYDMRLTRMEEKIEKIWKALQK